MTNDEKLSWAIGYVKYLKTKCGLLEFEIGILKSELSEAKAFNGSERIAELEKENKRLIDRWESRRVQIHKRHNHQTKLIKQLILENDNLKLNQK